MPIKPDLFSKTHAAIAVNSPKLLPSPVNVEPMMAVAKLWAPASRPFPRIPRQAAEDQCVAPTKDVLQISDAGRRASKCQGIGDRYPRAFGGVELKLGLHEEQNCADEISRDVRSFAVVSNSKGELIAVVEILPT